MAWRCAWALAALLGAASPVGGQELAKGRLVDASTGEPVGDAMVAVLDGRGVEQDRRLTGRSGTFEVLLAGSPPFTLVVERIGFRRHALPLDPGGRELVVRLTADPIELPGVTVATEPVCSISSPAATLLRSFARVPVVCLIPGEPLLRAGSDGTGHARTSLSLGAGVGRRRHRRRLLSGPRGIACCNRGVSPPDRRPTGTASGRRDRLC